MRQPNLREFGSHISKPSINFQVNFTSLTSCSAQLCGFHYSTLIVFLDDSWLLDILLNFQLLLLIHIDLTQIHHMVKI